MGRSAADWLGLAVRSESDQPHEWVPLLTVMRNRMESDRFPETADGVVRQPWQFSHFNRWRGQDPEVVYQEALETYAGDSQGWPHNDLPLAVEAASWVLDSPRWQLPLGPKAFYFWSPASMRPAGAVPSWNWSILRCFTLSGIDPWRFVFAEEVPRGHRLAGNVRKVVP